MTHPVDWRFQVYCNGPDEHYIDLACPFGKTNSPLEFCPPVALFARSASIRYSSLFRTAAPTLGTHVDDIFGGFVNNLSYHRACHFRDWMTKTGAHLTIIFNLKVGKTPLPAKEQIILGRVYSSTSRQITTAAQKREKYLLRLKEMYTAASTTRKMVEKLHGNLNYVADIEPYGRPFLSHLTNAIWGSKPGQNVILSDVAK